MKQIIPTYSFSASAKTVTFTELDSISLERVLLITNTTDNIIIYNFADPTKGGTVTGNVLSLMFDTTSMADTDKLNILYDLDKRDTSYEKSIVGNQRSFFKDGINTSVSQPDTSIWDMTRDSSNHIVNTGGNAAGSAYIRISLDPFTEDSGVTLSAKKEFQMPVRASFGVTSSQRPPQNELFFGMVGCDVNGNIATISSTTDKTLPAQTLTISASVMTVNLPNHGFVAGDRVSIFNIVATSGIATFATIPMANITVIDANNFTVPTTTASSTIVITSGTVRLLDPLYYVKNGVGHSFDTSTANSVNYTSRRDGAKYRRFINQTSLTLTPSQTLTDAYSDAWNSAGNFELAMTNDEVLFRNYNSDSNSAPTGVAKITQQTPDDSVYYKPYIRARNQAGISKPTVRVTGATKSGTTTATITFDGNHNLVANEVFGLYGVLDATNFPSASAYTVASVVSPTQITAVVGATTPSTSSSGGYLMRTTNSQALTGALLFSVQSISRTSNVLSVVGNTTWTGVSPGDYVNVYGMTGTAQQYEGAYKVLRINTTTLELQSTGIDFGSITTGGGVIRRTDVRIHYVRVTDYTKNITEVYGGRGNSTDANNAVPVVVTAALSVTQNTGAAATTTIWNAAGYGGVLVNDVVSAAITTSTTSSAITPGIVANIGTYSHSFSVSVTGASGTTPTMDVGVEESPDNGTTWVRIYDFPRITATGVYYSPQISATWGTRYRYVRTVGGSTPSFTHAINRIQFSSVPPFIREFQDRTIVATTLNSTTPTYFVDGCKNISLVVYAGTVVTTAAAYQLEGSENGSEWYAIGSPVTPATTTTSVTFNTNTTPKFARVRVSTAGVGVTGHYVVIKALGN